jgi:transcriptional regulator with XRE-family HTH domain
MSTTTAKPKTRLAQILEEEGRKQAWLAKKAGVDPGALSRYVHGLHVPDDKREAIAEALGRDVVDVFPAEATS